MILKSLLPVVVLLSLLAVVGCPVYAEETKTATKEALRKEVPVKNKLAQQDLTREKVATKPGERMKPATAAGNLREKVASKGAMLRERLATFKDKRKATVIERIATNLTTVNQRRTSQLMQHVDTLMSIMTKAEERATEMQGAGTDVSSLMSEITSSKNALGNAKIAVEQQSKKTYEIEIATESGAKSAVKETRDMLAEDLKSTHSLVKEARRVLINTLMKLGQSMGGGAQTNESN